MSKRCVNGKKILPIFLLIDSLVFFDQIIKWWVVNKGRFFISGDFFDVGFYKNYGIAFGLPLPYFFLFPTVLGAIILIIWRYWQKLKQGDHGVWLACLLIMEGAASNMFDRLYRGYVVDYLHFSFGSTFNIADILIVVGVGLLLRLELGSEEKSQLKSS